MTDSSSAEITDLLRRVAEALERLSPNPVRGLPLEAADAFIWRAEHEALEPVAKVNRVAFGLLKGIDRQADILFENTLRFARGFPANNALLWGARGMGKSSLVKAVHAKVNANAGADGHDLLALVEIHREDIPSLTRLLALLRDCGRRCVLFCDDLSFDGEDASYKSLKAVLEGGIEGRPENVLFYATSNRRHLMPRHDRERALHGDPHV